MYRVQMQASTNTATVLDPSTFHMTDALHIKANAAHLHVLGDTAGRESKEEGKGTKSSWFQRLKVRDDLELFRGTESTLETLKKDKGCASSLEIGLRTLQPDSVSRSAWSRPLPDWQAESSSASKCQNTHEEHDGVEAERQRCEKVLKSEIGRSVGIPKAALTADVGFGPWVNLSSGRRFEGERASNVSENEVAMSGHARCSSGNSIMALNALPKCSVGISQGDATTSSAVCKPPLSPVNNKIGLPPRPPSQKLSGFHSPSKIAALASLPGRRALHQLAFDNHHGHSLITPTNQILDVQDRESGKHGEAAATRIGSSSQKQKVTEGRISNLTWHSKGLTDCGEQFPSISHTSMVNGGMLYKEQPRPIAFETEKASVMRGQHIGSSSDVALGRMLEDGVGEPVRMSVSSNTTSMDLQLKVADVGTQTLKSSVMDGSMLQAVGLEHSKSASQAGGGAHHGTTRVDKQGAHASTSATLPWELFIEPACASQKAREQFVEVYNRARDELKNQRLLHNMSRSYSREVDGGPKLTLGPSGATSDVRLDRQSIKHGQMFSGHTEFQGKSMRLERESLPCPSSLKEQNAAESSHCRQVEGLRRVQPTTTEALSHKTAVPEEVMMEGPMQGVGAGSVALAKELRSGDKEGQIFSKISASGKELVSKLDNDVKHTRLSQAPRECQKQDNGQEAVPVLGKRSRVTFEDHALSLVVEKGAPSRAKPQCKPHLWLQRWHSTPKYNSNGLSADVRGVVSGGKRTDSSSLPTLGLKKLKDGDSAGVFGQANALAERVKSFKTSSSKVLPSAAAMAIVGTAARQFCSSQPQDKGSFAFWSGFGVPTYPKVDEPVQEKGKEKVFVKADNKNLPSY